MKRLINLERLKSHLSAEFGKTVKAIDKYLQKAVLNREVSELSQKEIKQIITNADGEIKDLLGLYVISLKDNWRSLFTHRYQLQEADLYDAYRRRLNTPKSLLKYADKVMSKPLMLSQSTGISLDEVLAKFEVEEAARITRAIRLAHHEGLPNSKLIQMIRGSKAKRYQDGILNISTRHAKSIANTGTALIASEAKQQFISDNEDLIKGIKVLATLDMRTSTLCRNLDGVFMPLNKARYPPYHFNCRTSFEIVYDGYQAPKQRASMDGVVENQSYYEWLKSQPNNYQDEVLGKKRAKLFRDGGLSIERFKELQLDKNFTPLTLEEMKAREPKAFKKAGIQ